MLSSPTKKSLYFCACTDLVSHPFFPPMALPLSHVHARFFPSLPFLKLRSCFLGVEMLHLWGISQLICVPDVGSCGFWNMNIFLLVIFVLSCCSLMLGLFLRRVCVCALFLFFYFFYIYINI